MIFEIKPLSINQAWYGIHRKTTEYRQFEKDLSKLIQLKKMKKHLGTVAIEITFYFKNSLSDIDNCVKPIFDILKKNGIIKDDRYVYRLEVIKKIAKQNYFEINIYDTK